MKNADDENATDEFGELLAGCPFDDSIREEHRREVRERAMRAFDESAAATVAAREQPPRRVIRRRVMRATLAMAMAASLAWAIIAWRQPARPRVAPGDGGHHLADASWKKREAANKRLVAALDLLSAFEEEQAALTFAQGIEVCVRDLDGQLAGEGS